MISKRNVRDSRTNDRVRPVEIEIRTALAERLALENGSVGNGKRP
jgi:hypothetical protein